VLSTTSDLFQKISSPADTGLHILQGDCLDILPQLPSESVQCCVTSPPYYGLRDYGSDGQLGLEKTPQEYVENLLKVFREVKRVLRKDGTLWLILGDTTVNKNLLGIPWSVAFALKNDGWILRRDVIWNKTNPTPYSVKDNLTPSHEFIFFFVKFQRYYYDSNAIKEPAKNPPKIINKNKQRSNRALGNGKDRFSPGERIWGKDGMSNKRDVWTLPVGHYKGEHFATFPPALITPCILAGSRPGDIILDPFAGSGTVGAVAQKYNRRAVLIELSAKYCELIRDRLGVRPLEQAA
jgi:DNA modification methylase